MARQASAEIVLVHIADDDQPPRLVKANERAAGHLLNDLATTLREVDRVHCETRVVLGEPFQAIAEAAEHVDAGVVVMGLHRRQALRDFFIGTTIRDCVHKHKVDLAVIGTHGRTGPAKFFLGSVAEEVPTYW